METNVASLLNHQAQNFLICLADFPTDLTPDHLDAPPEEREMLLVGLRRLHGLIGSIYTYFTNLTITGSGRVAERWSERETCYRAIEAPLRLLWALGVSGRLREGTYGPELVVERETLDAACRTAALRDPASTFSPNAFDVLEAVGLRFAYLGPGGAPASGGYKKCAAVVVRSPGAEMLLSALCYFSWHLPKHKPAEKGAILTIFMRGDLRPLMPGYVVHSPHLPAEEDEVTRTFDARTLEVWQAIKAYMNERHPEYRLYYRVPRLRGRGWVADYSTRPNDYGAWSIFTGEEGLYVRIVLNEHTVGKLFEQMDELTPAFQEIYLNAVLCKDCIHCGKHINYQHGDHVHRLCKTPWFFSPILRMEDLPDIERLIDIRLL